MTTNQNLYKTALINSMNMLGRQDDTIFIGQQLIWPGNPMSFTVLDVPKEKIIEVPLMEESQMGMTLGLAMAGKFVITFYPRWDFLLLATNQLVNNIDKLEQMSQGKWKPNIIVRVGKGSDNPIDPGCQHKANYINQFKSLMTTARFYDLNDGDIIEQVYNDAYNNGGISIIAEYPELYNK